MYPQRKQNLKDEIKRLEDSNEKNKEWKIKNLKKKIRLEVSILTLSLFLILKKV